MGQQTRIDWCDASWNPVTGCLHGCEYCYAERMVKRFGKPIKTEHDHLHVIDEPMRNTDTYEYMRIAGISAGRKLPYPFGFDPTFHRYRLDEPQKWTKPRTIFVCSMADLFGKWVPDWWIEAVLNACAAAPKHRYLFLTKNPGRYLTMPLQTIRPSGVDFWYGFTVTGSEHIEPTRIAGLKVFLSIEPLMCEPTPYMLDAISGASWVIIGAETGNRKGRVVPQREWVMRLANHAEKHYTYVFMKESLREIMGEDFRQEFPWEV